MKNAIIKLIIAEMRKGTEAPNLSHKIPAVKEPSITAKLESIVNNPMPDPLCSSGIKSETHAFDTPSVAAV